MALLPIITAPDPRLKQVAQPVETVDDDVRRLMDDMLETMYAAPGVGLAAPQVGVLSRLIVVDVARSGEEPQPMHLANPEIVSASDDVSVFEEGCLSLPEQYSEITRPDRIKLRYIDENNEEVDREASGLLATCIQHELDHLQGILFIDHLSSLKRNIILRRLNKLKKINAKSELNKSY